eukprot:CAMPEP_0171086292 /NCGR_PEP_ID=MMETSP0766_2-20121228/19458_1 /TAXON_ID=439317 /ORGANISM="Gambierdiscus australes, Strain CAWD 149" /LENGTH=66 /DNA_ID=CAMNT_0011543927 /DNA_START=53 /DNA_END=250 /DNA_ORIENTATION=-
MAKTCVAFCVAAFVATLLLTEWGFVQPPLPRVGAPARGQTGAAFPTTQRSDAVAEAPADVWRLALA